MKLLRAAARFYVSIGTVYALWAFVVLSFRTCGLFGGVCMEMPAFALMLQQLTLAVISGFRGLLWLPEMIIAVARSQLLDWLLLRNAYFIDVQQLLRAVQ